MTKKSLLAKYKPLITAGASAIEVKNAVTEAEKELSTGEVDDIVLALFDEVDDTAAPVGPAEKLPAHDGTAQHPSIKGKKNYNIFRGNWHPRKTVRGFDGKDIVIRWEFVPVGNAMKTGVPMEPEKVEVFNAGKRLRAGRVFTEQMVEVGYTGQILDEVDNPFQIRDVVS